MPTWLSSSFFKIFLSNAYGKSAPNTLLFPFFQGCIYQFLSGQTRNAPVDHGVDKVKDSLVALKATPKTGGVDDVVAGSLGTEISSMKEFHGLRNLDPGELTASQKARLKAIRDAIPGPANGETMQKVIKSADIEDYLDGTTEHIGGFVAKNADVGDLDTVDDLVEGLRLDYDGGFSGETEVGLLEFPIPQGNSAEIPYSTSMGGSLATDYPFSGNGFSATRKGKVVPEFRIGTAIDIPEGTNNNLDAAGNKVLQGTYQNGAWVEP